MIGGLPQVAPLVMSVLGMITVHGTSECPTPAAVAALLPAVSAPARDLGDQTMFINAAGSDLAITIVAADGSVRLDRRLPRAEVSSAGCSALASAVAVIVATWQIEQNPELSLLQPGVYPPEPAPPAAFRSEPPEPPGLSRGAELLAGLAVGTSVSQSAVIVTGEAQLGLRRPGGRLGIWLTLALDGQGQVAQSGGTSAWRRMTAGAGPSLALGQGPVRAEVGAEIFLGRTSVEGSGFALDRSDHAVSLGVEALARVVGGRAVQPFLETRLREWLAPQQIQVVDASQADSQVSLPRVEVTVAVGVRLRFGT